MPKATKKRKTTAKTEFPIGRITGAFGIRGELKCDPTSAGRSLFRAGASLRCELDGASRVLRIASLREHKGRLLLAVEGVEDADAAGALAGAEFFAPRELLDVGEGEYLDDDLVGCELFDAAGTAIGRVSRVEHYPASDMLIVNGKMVPLVRAFIRSIDVAKKQITADLPEGIFD